MIKNCEICGREFEPLSHNGKYCSDDCRKIAHNELAKKRRKLNPKKYEKYLENARRWYRKNKEKRQAYQREYRRFKIVPKGYTECRAAHDNCDWCEHSDCIY